MKPHSDRGVIGYNHYSTCYNLGMKRCTNSLHSGLQSSAGCIVAETQQVS